jgi:transcription elongation factor Elf1
MKEVILKLKNNRTISTKDIKCPVCGETMEIDNSKMEGGDSRSSVYLESMPAPFEGTLVKRRTDYTTRFKCPHECCHLEMEHYIENLIV